LATPSVDALSAPVRYEWLLPGQSTWAVVTFPRTLPLVANSANAFRVRAIDGAGHVSPEVAAQVVHDAIAPPAPTIVTPRLFVAATSTSIALGASASDSTFARYETCTYVVAANEACSGTCTFAPQAA